MEHVVVIGCGVVGAAIAYELSSVPGLKVTVLDQQPPAQGATGAALGVLMGVISHKIKGRAWQMRQTSIQRYETLIPELEALTGRQIPVNRQGILLLLIPKQQSGSAKEDVAAWRHLGEIRHSQGWQLEIWDPAHVKASCPQLDCEHHAVYSPQDRQIDPVALTLALVDAAQCQGVDFHFGVTVEGYALAPILDKHRCQKIHVKSNNTDFTLTTPQIPQSSYDVDWLVVAGGLGSFGICQELLAPPINIRPVLGQALHLRLGHSIGNPDFQPVITGNDVHIVPIGKGEYWVGATVEFPTNGVETVPDSARLNAVMQQAIAFCPSLAEATVVKTWSGLRPRPEGRPAPIIGQLPSYSNVLLATGHYRNGVLLAPATAQAIREMISS